MKLHTRQEIIDIWEKQSSARLSSYCCPNCRDILKKENNKYICANEFCTLEIIDEIIEE